MPKFRIWHGECDTYDEAKIVEAEDHLKAAATILFVYYEGDCDHGATSVKSAPGGRWIATRENSPDYFFIVEDSHD